VPGRRASPGGVLALADPRVFGLSATVAVAAHNYQGYYQSASANDQTQEEVPEPRRGARRLSRLWKALPETFEA